VIGAIIESPVEAAGEPEVPEAQAASRLLEFVQVNKKLSTRPLVRAVRSVREFDALVKACASTGYDVAKLIGAVLLVVAAGAVLAAAVVHLSDLVQARSVVDLAPVLRSWLRWSP
jgi:hypothetical protein